MIKLTKIATLFVLALSLGCADVGHAEEPAGDVAAELDGSGGLAAAVPYLEQGAQSIDMGIVEATVEIDESETVAYIDDAIQSMRTARALIVGGRLPAPDPDRRQHRGATPPAN